MIDSIDNVFYFALIKLWLQINKENKMYKVEKPKTKSFHCRIDDDFQKLLNELGKQHDIKWSKKVTKFLKEEVKRLQEEKLFN